MVQAIMRAGNRIFRKVNAPDGSHKTMVIFRVYPTGEVIGLMPCQITDIVGVFCLCYEPIHPQRWADKYMPEKRSAFTGALYSLVISQTRPATPEEAMALADELKDLGYSIATRQRGPSRDYKEKWLAMGND